MKTEHLRPEDLTAVVQLHQRVLGYTLNARIGNWFLQHLYTQLLSSPLATVLVIQDHQDVVGFISATTDHTQLSHQIMASLSAAQKIKIGWFLLIHPQWIPLCIRQFRFGSYLDKTFPQPLCTILTLGVDASIQGQGLGRSLMDEMLQLLKDHAVKQVILDTQTNNISAIRFYERYGFHQVSHLFGNVIFSIVP